ncbi:ATP-binding protein [Virgibacillus sp. C22-A2]|uniref:ATP-binding protein n=1 Tax=Virgibacillus tibetensis TaxID=3042313 RepID=A0ABU6KCD2_9BACI|nr:ATP-binding protein [Virgibacillus sp. C22-A2]
MELNKQSVEMKKNFFIGRKNEIEIFKAFIHPENHYLKILNIHGLGGIGKTYLLAEYSRIAKIDGLLFLKLDSDDFLHTPAGFADYLLILLKEKSDSIRTYTSVPLENCTRNLNFIASERRVIIAVDSYEKMTALDRWFREVFIRHINPNVFFIIAGRNSLEGEWKESPAWRKVTKQIELKDFNLEQTSSYLSHHGINNIDHVTSLWQFTEGHPLTLSLAAITNKNPNMTSTAADNLTENIPQILMELTKRWLHEATSEEQHRLIESAAVLHIFNQEGLSFVLNREISQATFKKLTSLSFIKSIRNGWAIHDQIRDAIRIELKH